MGLFDTLFSRYAKSTEARLQKELELLTLKRGKTDAQKKIIDFFVTAQIGAGCDSTPQRKSDMSLRDYFKLVEQRCNQIDFRQRAIEKIGLDESEISEIEPILLSSFVYADDSGEQILIKVSDKVAVSSRFSITWIFFSSTQVYIYSYVFDMISDSTTESTKDFFYSDITCFSTQRNVKEKIDVTTTSGCLSNSESVTKSNYVVDTMEIIVPGASYSISMRNVVSVEDSIQAAKAMMREKKFREV